MLSLLLVTIQAVFTDAAEAAVHTLNKFVNVGIHSDVEQLRLLLQTL